MTHAGLKDINKKCRMAVNVSILRKILTRKNWNTLQLLFLREIKVIIGEKSRENRKWYPEHSAII